MMKVVYLILLLLISSPVWAQTDVDSIRKEAVDLGIQGDLDKAQELFKMGAEKSPSDYVTQAAVKVIDDFKAGKVTKDFTEAYFKAVKFIEAGQIDEALPEFKKAIALSPKYPELYTGLSVIYSAQKDFDKAIEYSQKALELNPKDIDALANLCYLSAYQRNAYTEAVDYCQQAVAIDNQEFRLFQALGDAYYGLKDYENAIKSFEEAVKLKNDLDYAYKMIALCYSLRNDYQNAITYVEKALAINPNEPAYHMDLAMSYATLKNLDQAQTEFQKTLDLLNKSPKTDSVQENIKYVEEMMKKYKP